MIIKCSYMGHTDLSKNHHPTGITFKIVGIIANINV
jgi:hypothetical protein